MSVGSGWVTRLRRGGVALLVALAIVGSVVARPSASTTVLQRAEAPLPARVLLLGDSLMFDAAPALESALEANGAELVVDQSVLGLGLTRPDYADWRTLWPAAVERHLPDTVVVFVAPFDLADLSLTEHSTTEWQATYVSRVVEAVELVGRAARVIWILSPQYGDADLAGGVGVLNDAIVTAQRTTPFEILDPGPLDPADTDLRKDDGIHFCPDGAGRIAAELASHLELAAGPHPQGEWRNDARYDASLFGSICQVT